MWQGLEVQPKPCRRIKTEPPTNHAGPRQAPHASKTDTKTALDDGSRLREQVPTQSSSERFSLPWNTHEHDGAAWHFSRGATLSTANPTGPSLQRPTINTSSITTAFLQGISRHLKWSRFRTAPKPSLSDTYRTHGLWFGVKERRAKDGMNTAETTTMAF